MLVHNYEIEYMERVDTMPKRLFAHAEINMAEQQQIDNDPSGYFTEFVRRIKFSCPSLAEMQSSSALWPLDEVSTTHNLLV